MREYLRTPGINLGLVKLPGYSPDFNADEAVWGWVREEATGNLCLGTKSWVQERVGSFLAALASRKDDVKLRCRSVLQSRVEAPLRARRPDSLSPANAHTTLARSKDRPMQQGLYCHNVRKPGSRNDTRQELQMAESALEYWSPSRRMVPVARALQTAVTPKEIVYDDQFDR